MNIVSRRTKREPKILKTIYDSFGSDTTKYYGDLSQQNFMGTKNES